jgi:hypothetical protein
LIYANRVVHHLGNLVIHFVKVASTMLLLAISSVEIDVLLASVLNYDAVISFLILCLIVRKTVLALKQGGLFFLCCCKL